MRYTIASVDIECDVTQSILFFDLTEQQKKNLLKKLPDPNITSSNSCYTYLFQRGLAKYFSEYDENSSRREWMETLYACSKHFKPLEPFIHRKKNPNELKQALLKYQEDRIKTFLNYKNKIPDHPVICVILDQLEEKLQASLSIFIQEIDTLKKPTDQQLKELYCIQKIGATPSLGNFMASQIFEILSAGIQMTYLLGENRLPQLIHLPKAIAVLSDIKKWVEIKSKTLDGVEYNDMYSPIPKQMIDTLEGNDDSPSIKHFKTPFSAASYVTQWTPLALDQMICLATETPLDQRTLPPFYLDLLAILASIIEIFFVFCIRLPITIFLSVISLFGAQDFSEKTDCYWSSIHQKYSPVLFVKTKWNASYQRTNPDEDHQKLLMSTMKSTSFFHDFFLMITPNLIADSMKDFFKSLLKTLLKIPQDLCYLLSYYQYDASSKEVYEKIKIAHHALPLLPKKIRPVGVVYCQKNNVVSLLKVIQNAMVILSDTVIDPMFRKSPIIAPFFFTISILTLISYPLMPFITNRGLKIIANLLQAPVNSISLHFTGKSTAFGFKEQILACFLEWKLCFFSSELGMEIYQENYEILNGLFQEPEQLTLGMIGLMITGISFQYLPTLNTTLNIPGLPPIFNYYAAIINLFIEEAKGCQKGTFPFTLFEDAILGLQFLMVFNALGLHQKRKNSVLIKQLISPQNKAIPHTKKSYLLKEALNILSDERLEQLLANDPLIDAHKLFDYLYDLFEDHDHDFLSLFYNKYCYQESNYLLRSLIFFPIPIPIFPYVIPAYVFVVLFREIKRVSARYYHKPSIEHGINKSYAEDKVLLFQCLAIISRVFYAFNRAMSYLLRGFVGSLLLIGSALPVGLYNMIAWFNHTEYYTCEQWFNQIAECTRFIALHRIVSFDYIRPWYAQAAREAGNISNLEECSSLVLNELKVL